MSERRVVIGPEEGEVVLRGGVGVVSKVSGAETNGAYAVVEHPLEPGALAAPPHTHADVDEVSFVVEGEVGVWMDGEEFTAGVGSYILKPRGIPHTFWNAGAERARVVEIISPAGFERYFEELAGILSSTPPGEPPDFGRIMELAARYNMTFHMEKMPEIMERHNVELR
ncbi:MAG: cupin domain-containing protein [Rubrobacteraceae bacterium]